MFKQLHFVHFQDSKPKENDLSISARAEPSMRSTLKQLVRPIHRFTIQLLDNDPPEWLTGAPTRIANHMLWHAGNSQYGSRTSYASSVSLRNPNCSRVVGQHCEPLAEHKYWPEPPIVKLLLVGQKDRLSTLIEGVAAEQLKAKVDDPKDLVGRIIHGLHDEAKYHGKMNLLRQLCVAWTGSGNVAE